MAIYINVIMKKSCTHFLVACIALGSLFLNSCIEKDVDLTNIDGTTSVQTSLALPVGSMQFKFSDFIGENAIPQLSIDDKGRYVYTDTMYTSGDYNPVDLSALITHANDRWNINDEKHQIFNQLETKFPGLEQNLIAAIPGFTGYNSIDTIPVEKIITSLNFLGKQLDGLAFDLEFPIEIDLSQLNNNFNDQRVDSILVDTAHFTSIFKIENFDLQWENIKGIELVLSDNFRGIGPVVPLPIKDKNFYQPLSLDLQDFHLVLMKDPQAESSGDNIVDSIALKIRFKIELTKDLAIDGDRYIGYDFKVDLIDYSAMYGYFAAYNLMRDTQHQTPIASLWSGWEWFENWLLPVNEPVVHVEVEHSLGLPMVAQLDYLYVEPKDGEPRYATFDEAKQEKSKIIHIPSQIAMDDPLEKRAHTHLQLDYTDTLGNIDTLFTITPHTLSYSFSVSADSTSDIKQYRITDNTDINLATTIRIPFAFNEGVQLSYSDTLSEIAISEFSLDSLLQSLPIEEDSLALTLKLYMVVENGIPFEVVCNFMFLDENNDVVTLSRMTDSVATLKLDYPTVIASKVTEPSINHISLELDDDDFDLLASVRSIVFTAALGNNMDAVELNPDITVNVKLGVAADVKAIIDLSELF
jgi:hypothetical protein